MKKGLLLLLMSSITLTSVAMDPQFKLRQRFDDKLDTLKADFNKGELTQEKIQESIGAKAPFVDYSLLLGFARRNKNDIFNFAESVKQKGPGATEAEIENALAGLMIISIGGYELSDQARRLIEDLKALQ